MEQESILAQNLKIKKILNGMWQVSGTHGYIEPKKAILAMQAYHTAGFTTWDLADIYGPAESYIGKFRDTLQDTTNHTALTKFVPNPGIMTRGIVESSIKNSQSKMHTAQLDLVQFHWWDYSDTNYLTALDHLTNLKDENQLKQIGLTNFNTSIMQTILDHGTQLVSNQVQYSILDTRPQVQMQQFCKDNKIQILAYGTILGGLFSERFLNADEPYRGILDTASLQKYKNMIDAWGGWELFQELLSILDIIAKKHQCSIPNVATRYILDQPQVAGVIIGARLSISEHIADNQNAYSLKLDTDDYSTIKEIQAKSQNLFESIGDCGDEYR